jgi:hypothetical protein
MSKVSLLVVREFKTLRTHIWNSVRTIPFKVNWEYCPYTHPICVSPSLNSDLQTRFRVNPRLRVSVDQFRTIVSTDMYLRVRND